MTTKTLAQRLPADFRFGVATAAFQIEGATQADGRGASIWDAFSHMPGRVYKDHNGNIACDHYNRVYEDLDLIKQLSVDAYRFSIAWPRIMPLGRGQVNEAGLDFYERLIDGLVERDIKVFPTLYHWDLPLNLMGYGGWTDRNTSDAFAEYTSAVVRRFGDRIDAMSTFNEPWCASYLGHYVGKHAPGEKSLDAALAATHVINLAHGKSVMAARAERSDIQMGVVLNSLSTYAATDSKDDTDAAERYFQFHNEIYFGPMFAGKYGDEFMDAYGDKLRMQDGDLEIAHQPLDWWGFNYYYPNTVKNNPDPKAAFPATLDVPSTTTDVRTDIGWEIRSEGMTNLLSQVYDRYNLPPCYITENGASYNMGVGEDGTVDDEPRRAYLEDHIGTVADAIDTGIPMKGYFVWSLMDNYEWAEGYKMRFGIVHVDYDTQVRTIKDSGHWYAQLCVDHEASRN